MSTRLAGARRMSTRLVRARRMIVSLVGARQDLSESRRIVAGPDRESRTSGRGRRGLSVTNKGHLGRVRPSHVQIGKFQGPYVEVAGGRI
ncbi:hypothetical protein Acr_12g0001700 [Actinidia rufa]|uniref:Uncharacterized protein n=1 Tax=Actinidia rufa TaxID=165716 RepID=A0A7J0FHI5_9ERIC|nr:hypothetical protein Acr_12g0001700 [Actinidia rufa]